MPALQKARESAMQTACINNLKQLGIGQAMYAGDFRGFLPWANNMHGASTDDDQRKTGWDNRLLIYVGGSPLDLDVAPDVNRPLKIYQCAADLIANHQAPPANASYHNNPRPRNAQSYAVIGNDVFSKTDLTQNNYSKKYARLDCSNVIVRDRNTNQDVAKPSPSKTMRFVEQHAHRVQGQGAYTSWNTVTAVSTNMNWWSYHGGANTMKSSVLFFDGRAITLNIPAFSFRDFYKNYYSDVKGGQY
jgi:hypothetical protein